MNVNEIKERVKSIKKDAWDSEVAHGKEGELYRDFVEYIAENGRRKQRRMAKEVLKTLEINFKRYYS